MRKLDRTDLYKRLKLSLSFLHVTYLASSWINSSHISVCLDGWQRDRMASSPAPPWNVPTATSSATDSQTWQQNIKIIWGLCTCTEAMNCLVNISLKGRVTSCRPSFYIPSLRRWRSRVRNRIVSQWMPVIMCKIYSTMYASKSVNLHDLNTTESIDKWPAELYSQWVFCK